jgi:L-amino acid N-acyltransferase
VIRLATAADAPAIAAIWNTVIADSVATFNSQPYTDATMAALIQARATAGHATFVDQALTGFVTYAQFRGGVGYRFSMEHTIHLTPAAQGRGLGRALMAAVEDHARVAGGHSMIAGIGAENAVGIAFHARMGYAQVARVPQVGLKFGRWMDLILMQKFLQKNDS